MTSHKAWAAIGLGALLGACSSSQQAQIKPIPTSALGHLNEQQLQPVDAARVDAGRARDQYARSQAAVQDAKAKLQVAQSEKQVAVAQQDRAKSEREMLEKQNADPATLDRARKSEALAAQRVQASDLKIDYQNKAINVAQAEEQVAAQHVNVANASAENAKLQALRQGDPNAVRNINPQQYEAAVSQAQAKEAELRGQAANQRVELVDSYNKWQELDAKVRAQTPRGPAAPLPAAPAEPPKPY
jgi:hypothetical protein